MQESFERTKPKVTVKSTLSKVENIVLIALAISHIKTPKSLLKKPKDNGFWINRSKRSIY